MDPNALRVTVVGGHSGNTIVPLLSQTGIKLTDEEIKQLTHRIQFGGDEVVAAKDGAGSATLSMAFAGARFTNSILEAIGGKAVIEPSFVFSNVVDGINYFASNVELNQDGVSKVFGIGTTSPFEQELLKVCIPELKASIEKGVQFAKSKLQQ